MGVKLIRTRDGLLFEAVVSQNEVEQIAGGLAERVDASLDLVQQTIERLSLPLSNAWKVLSRETTFKEIEVEFGLSFEGEGNLFVAKSKTTANFSVKVVLSREEKSE